MDWIMSRALLLHLIFLCLFPGEGSAENAEAFFVLGDSAADTGNRNPYIISLNGPWRPPYGMTWPGFPTGRFSSGKVQTDFWADPLGLPTPTPYELLKSHDCKTNDHMIRGGLNCAVGGSGITRAYGFITVSQQVKQFKKLLAGSRVFDSHKLSRSIVLISVAGNDYLSFVDSRNGSTEGLPSVVKPVLTPFLRVSIIYGFLGISPSTSSRWSFYLQKLIEHIMANFLIGYTTYFCQGTKEIRSFENRHRDHIAHARKFTFFSS